MRTILVKLFLGSSLMVQASSAAHSEGLLILFDDSTTSLEAGKNRLEAKGCDVWRKGSMTARGSMDLGQVNRFILADCKQSLLEVEADRAELQESFRSGQNGIVLEGDFIRKEVPFANTETAKTRGYLVKISRFNNEIAERFSEEDKIDADGKLREESWTGEARLRIKSAIGMPTPDEVGVIYYETKTSMQDFVGANPDIVDRITEFNQRHLIESNYLIIEVE